MKHEGFASEADLASHSEGWFEYLELWSIMHNVGPESGVRASISGFVPLTVDVPDLLASWLGKDSAIFRSAPEESGIRRFQNSNLAAQWQPTKFGISLALTEWGLASEEQRLARRKHWHDCFNAAGGHS